MEALVTTTTRRGLSGGLSRCETRLWRQLDNAACRGRFRGTVTVVREGSCASLTAARETVGLPPSTGGWQVELSLARTVDVIPVDRREALSTCATWHTRVTCSSVWPDNISGPLQHHRIIHKSGPVTLRLRLRLLALVSLIACRRTPRRNVYRQPDPLIGNACPLILKSSAWQRVYSVNRVDETPHYILLLLFKKANLSEYKQRYLLGLRYKRFYKIHICFSLSLSLSLYIYIYIYTHTLPSISLETHCILQINNRMAAICADFSYEYIARRLNDDMTPVYTENMSNNYYAAPNCSELNFARWFVLPISATTAYQML